MIDFYCCERVIGECTTFATECFRVCVLSVRVYIRLFNMGIERETHRFLAGGGIYFSVINRLYNLC